MNMRYVASVVWSQCIDAKKDENALIITDPSGERLEIGKALLETGRRFCKCELIKMKPTGLAGREPWAGVAKTMLDYDIIIAPLKYSITHTRAVDRVIKKGGRVVTMPGITKDIFMRAVPVDYGELEKTGSRIKAALESGNNIRITTKAGTDITMEMVEGRKIHTCDGVVNPGKVNNLPDGEVAIAPKEGASNGIIVFDVSSLNTRLKKPFKAVVKDGFAISCENKKIWNILTGVENGTNLAELGIGINPKARITGNILEDEKVRGTAHIAFGTSAALGGLIQTDVHLDSVFDKPTIEVDGKVIIKDGKFLF